MTTPTFRTTEISEPIFESNHLRFITVKSPNLKGRGDICVFIPPVNQLKHAPLVILLHGVYGSSWAWSHQGGVHFIANQLIQQQEINPMVIAMPSDGLWGDGSAYLPHNGYDFEKWIVEDVPAAVMQHIEGVDAHSKLLIGGLSMGGFGALHLGVNHAHIFSGISAHSAITDISQMSLFVEEDIENYRQVMAYRESVWESILRNRSKLPPMRFDCGTDDPLLPYNQLLHRKLSDAKIPHIYQEFAGGHEWPYWQRHVKDSLLFFDQVNR